ncbi:NAD(P)-binding protein [Paxillus ammoniavirescens]|nr:NAD(P)-binding protein [Paxillus ammoniavirescens]
MASSLITPKVWLVTGASSGFGRLVTERALEHGDIVVATLRTPSMISDLSTKYPPSQLFVLQLDVSDALAITSAFNQAITSFNRIDVVFNNAGFYVVGEVEAISDKSSRAMFDAMFWGAGNVMREAVRCFRDVNRPMGGRLLNVSSRTALIPQPGSVLPALESLTEGYAAELDPSWNIKLVLFEPALFRTSAIASSVMEPPLPAYASNPSLPSMRYRTLYPDIEKTHFDGDPVKFADLVFRVAAMEDPPVLMHIPLHRVAVDSARKKGEMYIEAAEKLAGWSDDIYFINQI